VTTVSWFVCAEIRPRQVVLPSSTDQSRPHQVPATTRSTSEEIALDEATASLRVRRHNESGMTSALHPALAVVRPTVSRLRPVNDESHDQSRRTTQL